MLCVLLLLQLLLLLFISRRASYRLRGRECLQKKDIIDRKHKIYMALTLLIHTLI